VFGLVEKDTGERAKTDTTDIPCVRHAPKKGQTIFCHIGQISEQGKSTDKRQWFLIRQLRCSMYEHHVPRFLI
jgi:hypothetical protein